MKIHIVQPGETVQSIAALYGVSSQRLIFDNQLTDLPYLPVGMSILVLNPSLVHTVKEGETATEIAAMYGLSERKLYQNNPYLLNREYLISGQNLVIQYEGQEEQKRYAVSGRAFSFLLWIYHKWGIASPTDTRRLDDTTGLADECPSDSSINTIL